MMIQQKQEIERLREKLEQLSSEGAQSYLSILDDLFQDLIYIFKYRNDTEIKKLRDTAEYLINDYLDKYDQDVISEALDVYSKEEINLTINEYGKYEVPFLKLLELRDEFICTDITNTIRILNNAIYCLDYGLSEFEDEVKDIKDYEVMGGLALNLIEDVIYNANEEEQRFFYDEYKNFDVFDDLLEISKKETIKYGFRACMAVKEAKEMKLHYDFTQSETRILNKLQDEFKKSKKTIEKETLTKRAKKAADRRHKGNRENKQAFLDEYAREYKKAKEKNEFLSKNSFAKSHSRKYGYEECTTREWLKKFKID